MPSIPLSTPCSDLTCSVSAFWLVSWPFATTLTSPLRSVARMRPSGRNASSHGTSRPVTSCCGLIVSGPAGEGVGGVGAAGVGAALAEGVGDLGRLVGEEEELLELPHAARRTSASAAAAVRRARDGGGPAGLTPPIVASARTPAGWSARRGVGIAGRPNGRLSSKDALDGPVPTEFLRGREHPGHRAALQGMRRRPRAAADARLRVLLRTAG